MSTIFTASWSVQLPASVTAIGISRGVPRNHSGARRLRELEPGPWFKSVPPQEYLRRYTEILNALDPIEITDRLFALGKRPVLLCHERARDIRAGRCFCHRHLVAEWLEQTSGITVVEFSHPLLDRFAYLRALGIDRPEFCRDDPRGSHNSLTAINPASDVAETLRNTAAERLSAQKRRPMLSHKFEIGDFVSLTPGLSRFASSDVFEVIKHLPGSNEPEYRIKSVNEPHERAARESELIKPSL